MLFLLSVDYSSNKNTSANFSYIFRKTKINNESKTYSNPSYTTLYDQNVDIPIEPLKPRDPRAIELQNFLSHCGSYLADHTDQLISLSDYYGIDYRIIVALAGVESNYCQVMFKPYNCWGYGNIGWSSGEEAVYGYTRGMNIGYFSKGRVTIESIAEIYNPNPESFIEKVYKYYYQIP